MLYYTCYSLWVIKIVHLCYFIFVTSETICSVTSTNTIKSYLTYKKQTFKCHEDIGLTPPHVLCACPKSQSRSYITLSLYFLAVFFWSYCCCIQAGFILFYVYMFCWIGHSRAHHKEWDSTFVEGLFLYCTFYYQICFFLIHVLYMFGKFKCYPVFPLFC